MNIRSIVCSCIAVVSAFCQAETKTFTGGSSADAKDWFLGDNWSGQTVPTASDDVVIGTGAKVVATNSIAVGSLALTDAQLTLGGGEFQARPKISVTVTGDVTLSGASKLYAYAAEIDYDSFVDQATAIAAMRTGAMEIKIGGNFTVGDTSVVYPECAELTGTPVFFWVAGNFSLAEGAKFDVVQRGWGWNPEPWTDHPTYAKPCRTEGGWKDFGWTFAFAPGHSRFGPGNNSNYGYQQTGITESRDSVSYSYGANYGTSFAPFLPGSPCGGHYMNNTLSDARNYRGSGSIVVLSQGAAQIDGQMTADGVLNHDEGSAGGGILLAADSFAFGSSAALSAQGGDRNFYLFPAGCGGRIALLVGFDEEELLTVLGGALPAGSVESPTIEGVAVSVRGGAEGESFAGSGTCSYVLSSTKQATLTTRSNVDGLSAAGVAWGDAVLTNGVYTRTAPRYAVLIEDPTIEYTCQGYVLSNKTEQVAAAADLTVEFAIDGSEGPYALTWLWGDPHEKEPDPVVRRWVGPSGGSLSDAANWDPSGVPTSVDLLYVTNATISANTLKFGKLVVSGGKLTIGSSQASVDIAFDVKGDVTFCDGAQVSFYAPKKSDPTAYTSVAVARDLLWTNRTKIKVGGTLSVSGGATVKIANDPETGDLVVFEVGSFNLAADGAMNADGTGFAQLKKGDKTFDEGTIVKIGTAYFDKTKGVACYTYGFGTTGTGYGASGLHDYGYDFAPFEPGSCGGAYSDTTPSIGGGSVVVLAKGSVTLAGTLSADADLNGSATGPSGGSVWVAGATLDLADGLVVSAQGKSQTHWAYGAGAGGRVALMSEVTNSEQIATLVSGTQLTGHSYDTLSFDGLRVKAIATDGSERGTVGTAVRGYDASNYEAVTETAVPLEATSALAKYGSSAVGPGVTVTRSITEIGGDLTDPANVRYVCTGYVVSNATEEIAAGATRELTFTVVKGAGPYKITWLWGIRETRSQVLVTGPGAVTINGENVSEAWSADTANVTFSATPETGKTFWTWVGSDVPRAQSAQLNMAILADKPHAVRAVFCDTAAEARTCTCTSKANDDFYDPTNWTDGVVPNPQDKIVLSAGDLKVSRRFACSALTLTGSAKLSAEVIDEIAIAGNVCLSNSAVWTVTAQPTNTATAFADGATRVNIAGKFVVADTASVKPVCDALTGGTVVFNVKSFSLDAGASVNADEAGWGWVDYTGEPAAGATTYAYKNDSKGYDIHRQTLAVGRGDGYGNGGSHAQKGNTKSGPAYGFANAPVLPGSPNGCYNESSPHGGGGLIRIHVQGLATVNGTLTANGCQSNTYGGPSGGGIWLTARAFSFGEGAVLRARGGNSAYSYSYGSGGRIAIGKNLTDDDIAGLAETGAFALKRHVKDEAAFRAEIGNGAMTIDVRPNSSDPDRLATLTGTFSYVDGKRDAFMLLVR